MWHSIEVNSKKYGICCQIKDSEYMFCMSDMITLWNEKLSKSIFLLRCKDLNPLLEVESDILMKRILRLLDGSIKNVDVNLCDETDFGFTLQLKCMKSEVPCRIKLNFQKAPFEEYYNVITLPLLAMVEELQIRQNLLVNMIEKKDIEINEYKMEGYVISRRNVETEPFNEASFREKCSNIPVPVNLVLDPLQILTETSKPLWKEISQKLNIAMNKCQQEKDKVTDNDINMESSNATLEQPGTSDSLENEQNIKVEEEFKFQPLEVPEKEREDKKEIKRKKISSRKALRL